MKTKEEILDQVNFFIAPSKKEQILTAMEEYATQSREDLVKFDEDEIKEMACDFVINTGGLPKDLETWQEALWKFYKHTRTRQED